MDNEERSKLRGLHICVIGDVMLDVFAYGNITRVSPEAPVPVLDIENEHTAPGGALNVCQNLISLGVNTAVIGVTGDDTDALRLEHICRNSGINADGLLKDPGRVTTCKTRFFDADEALMRVDKEQRIAVGGGLEKRLEEATCRALEKADACILQDYKKGVLSPGLIRFALACAKKHRIPVFVDPKFENVSSYAGACLIKPNRREAEEFTGRRIRSIEDAREAADELYRRLSPEHILLTLGSEGMILKNADAGTHLPAHPVEMADITGAGDTVIATLAAFHTSGKSIAESAETANFAASQVCAHPGVTAVTAEMLSRME